MEVGGQALRGLGATLLRPATHAGDDGGNGNGNGNSRANEARCGRRDVPLMPFSPGHVETSVARLVAERKRKVDVEDGFTASRLHGLQAPAPLCKLQARGLALAA
ncbi:hypothetical protein B2J93_569 [Marssonina coronariae]|uniref:Uncharacterized protein n=1 Tax=Diplocarpon coronariae TaxID=2795749 RepID=A0A218ZAB4_9HELO|nr:hypothetical protein B2J93_569 [Marssonina coronariae]